MDYIRLRDALYNCAHNSDNDFVCQKCKYNEEENCKKKVLMDAYDVIGDLYSKIEELKKFLQEKNIFT